MGAATLRRFAQKSKSRPFSRLSFCLLPSTFCRCLADSALPSFMTDAVSDPGQVLLVGMPGPELDPATAAMLRRVQPGGYILFTRNITSPPACASSPTTCATSARSSRSSRWTRKAAGSRGSRPSATNRPARRSSACATTPRSCAATPRSPRDCCACSGSTSISAPCSTCACNGDETVDNSLRGPLLRRDRRAGRAAGGGLQLRTPLAAGSCQCGKHFPGYTCAREDAHHSNCPSSNAPARNSTPWNSGRSARWSTCSTA